MQKKITIGFKKLKVKIFKRGKKIKKKNTTELQKPSVEAQVHNKNKSMTKYTQTHP